MDSSATDQRSSSMMWTAASSALAAAPSMPTSSPTRSFSSSSPIPRWGRPVGRSASSPTSPSLEEVVVGVDLERVAIGIARLHVLVVGRPGRRAPPGAAAPRTTRPRASPRRCCRSVRRMSSAPVASSPRRARRPRRGRRGCRTVAPGRAAPSDRARRRGSRSSLHPATAVPGLLAVPVQRARPVPDHGGRCRPLESIDRRSRWSSGVTRWSGTSPTPEVRDIYPLRRRPCVIRNQQAGLTGPEVRQGRHRTVATLSDDGRAGRSARQKAPAPFGVPSPVGPSQPDLALHHWVVGQLPLLPDVTSNRLAVWAYGMELA